MDASRRAGHEGLAVFGCAGQLVNWAVKVKRQARHPPCSNPSSSTSSSSNSSYNIHTLFLIDQTKVNTCYLAMASASAPGTAFCCKLGRPSYAAVRNEARGLRHPTDLASPGHLGCSFFVPHSQGRRRPNCIQLCLRPARPHNQISFAREHLASRRARGWPKRGL